MGAPKIGTEVMKDKKQPYRILAKMETFGDKQLTSKSCPNKNYIQTLPEISQQQKKTRNT